MLDTNNNTSRAGGRKRNANASMSALNTTSNKRKNDTSMSAKVKKSKLVVPPINDRGTGKVYTFGTGDCGQLGLGSDILKRNYPSLVGGIEGRKILQVAAGGMHTVALDDAGKVWTFGLNDDFALGRRTEEENANFEPGQVKVALERLKVVQISAGDSHSAALTEDGQVFAWGTFKDMNGNFGLLPGQEQQLWGTPQLISGGIEEKVFKIASGDHHLVMLTEDGKVFTCGTGEQGQLGRAVNPEEAAELGGNRRVTRSQTTSANNNNSGAALNTRDMLLTPTEVKVSRKKFRDVWCGNFSTYLRTERNNEIWVFGLNNYFQLGLENEELVRTPTKSTGFKGNKWTQIAAGQHHAVALDEEGKVYTLGRGTDGRLGLGEENVPEALSTPTLVPDISQLTFVQIAAGLSTAYAVSRDGKLYAWGCGVNYQLGTGTTEDLFSPEPLHHMVLDGKKADFTQATVFVSAGGQHVAATISTK